MATYCIQSNTAFLFRLKTDWIRKPKNLLTVQCIASMHERIKCEAAIFLLITCEIKQSSMHLSSTWLHWMSMRVASFDSSSFKIQGWLKFSWENLTVIPCNLCSLSCVQSGFLWRPWRCSSKIEPCLHLVFVCALRVWREGLYWTQQDRTRVEWKHLNMCVYLDSSEMLHHQTLGSVSQVILPD